jgi:hypothetical protein
MRAVIDPLEFLPTDAVLRRRLEAEDPDRLVAELVDCRSRGGGFRRPRQSAPGGARGRGSSPDRPYPVFDRREPARRAVARYEPCIPVGSWVSTLVRRSPTASMPARGDAGRRLLHRGRGTDGTDGPDRLGAGGRVRSALAGGRGVGDDGGGDRSHASAATWELARRQRAWFRGTRGSPGSIRCATIPWRLSWSPS